MNWTKVFLAGLAGGFVTWLVDFVLHGLILGKTYGEHAVFTKAEANPFWFLAIAILIAFFAALLFAKTRRCWGEGLKGGATYGLFLGLVLFFANFYYPLVLEGFPYFLSWCWGGIDIIDGVVAGSVFGLILKKS